MITVAAPLYIVAAHRRQPQHLLVLSDHRWLNLIWSWAPFVTHRQHLQLRLEFPLPRGSTAGLGWVLADHHWLARSMLGIFTAHRRQPLARARPGLHHGWSGVEIGSCHTPVAIEFILS